MDGDGRRRRFHPANLHNRGGGGGRAQSGGGRLPLRAQGAKHLRRAVDEPDSRIRPLRQDRECDGNAAAGSGDRRRDGSGEILRSLHEQLDDPDILVLREGRGPRFGRRKHPRGRAVAERRDDALPSSERGMRHRHGRGAWAWEPRDNQRRESQGEWRRQHTAGGHGR